MTATLGETGEAKRPPIWTGILLLFGCFIALCALFFADRNGGRSVLPAAVFDGFVVRRPRPTCDQSKIARAKSPTDGIVGFVIIREQPTVGTEIARRCTDHIHSVVTRSRSSQLNYAPAC